MIRPSAFGPNPETAETNTFQGNAPGTAKQIQSRALAEFDHVVDQLREVGVEVYVFGDTQDPPTPDAIFPNNWFSSHSDGTVVLYPMHAESRRMERRPDLFDSLIEDHRFLISRFIDFTDGESSGNFLEGTGSLVLDHLDRIAFAALSDRTNLPILDRFSGALDFEVHSFHAEDRGVPIYHTNVILALGRSFAILAEETIASHEERQQLRDRLRAGGRTIISISREQCRKFAGNVLELDNGRGESVIVLSDTAWESLDSSTQKAISGHGQILTAQIPTIEQVGGGGVRCMIAELFLPRIGEEISSASGLL